MKLEIQLGHKHFHTDISIPTLLPEGFSIRIFIILWNGKAALTRVWFPSTEHLIIVQQIIFKKYLELSTENPNLNIYEFRLRTHLFYMDKIWRRMSRKKAEIVSIFDIRHSWIKFQIDYTHMSGLIFKENIFISSKSGVWFGIYYN